MATRASIDPRQSLDRPTPTLIDFLLLSQRMSGISTDEEDESPRLKEEQGIISKGNSPARNTQQPDSDRKSVVAMSASDDRRQGKLEDLAKQPKRPRAAMKVDASNFNDDGYQYPEWYSSSVARSPTYGLEKNFVGSEPLFPECPDAARIRSQEEEKPSIPKPFIPESKNPCWREKLEQYSRIILGKDINRLQRELTSTGHSELICGIG
ncbi:hypothetical protein C0Q70_14693 [Pomacea canaliculata]|uniref:Uncharacterized protein n=1 Tax=Pomacea canaliculata TaxID=400727 RepID=A0A2T7NSU8_POMCA|nr:hypothetical protein C0Q70_14693 [Pomacea canaliculata]